MSQQNPGGLQEQDRGMVSSLVFSTLGIVSSGFRYLSLTLTRLTAGTQLLLDSLFCNSVTIQFLLLWWSTDIKATLSYFPASFQPEPKPSLVSSTCCEHVCTLHSPSGWVAKAAAPGVKGSIGSVLVSISTGELLLKDSFVLSEKRKFRCQQWKQTSVTQNVTWNPHLMFIDKAIQENYEMRCLSLCKTNTRMAVTHICTNL